MKITGIYLYPIKGLRGIPLDQARLTPQGLKYDRRFSLWRIPDDGVSLQEKIQVFTNPEAALFDQRVVGLDEDDVDRDENVSYAPRGAPAHSRTAAGAPDADGADVRRDRGAGEQEPAILVRYLTPQAPIVPEHPAQATELRVPLCPDTANLDPVTVTMYKSSATAFRMGREYDAWFTACFGFPVALVYIGDGRRPQLGFQPGTPARTPRKTPLATLLHLFLDCVARCVAFLLALPTLAAAEDGKRAKHPPKAPEPWITFTDFAPFLIASESSLAHLSASVSDTPLEMHRFRPNILIGPSSPRTALDTLNGDSSDSGLDQQDDLPPWDEDFWSELSVAGSPVFKLTGNCARCTSVNVDYETGRPTKGPRGTVLKTLAKTRRVDKGKRWEAIFGRYASLAVAPETPPLKWWAGGGWSEGAATAKPVTKVAVGDPVRVTRRNRERDVWDWPPLK